MEKSTDNIFTELKKDLSTYVDLKLEVLKLHAYEKSGKLIAIFSLGIVLMLLGLGILMFLSISLAYYFSALFGNFALGFLVVAGIFILIAVILYLLRKTITVGIMNMVINTALSKDKNYNKEENETNREVTKGEGETE